ncbi:MAG: DUF29 domain-containing protein [Rhizobiaceae bacterium]|nr:DUF29 domain-containing protein [Rhizobiaceae bacterium]
MNKIDLRPPLVSIDEDYALWCAQQGALLREGRVGALDRENLAEEIEGLGSSHADEIESRLMVLLAHLLKWRFQPSQRSNSWRATIKEQRSRIARRLRQSPSLRSHPGMVLADEYDLARTTASGETGLDEEAFPPTCPFTIEQVLDPEFLPD